MTNRKGDRLSAACAALLTFVVLGCMGGSSEKTTTCNGWDIPPRPRPAQYADLGTSGAYLGEVSVGKTVTGTVTISNSGNTATSSFTIEALPSPFAWAGGSYPGTGGTCGASIAPADRCKLVIAFSPTETSTNVANVAIRYLPPPYTDVAQGVTSMHLSGRARPQSYAELRTVPPQELQSGSVQSGSVQFGSVPVGSEASATLTVKNEGNAATTSLAADALQPPFAYAGGSFPGVGGTCGSSLAAGASCTIAFTYSATAAGSAYGVFHLRYTPAPYTDEAEGNVFVSLYGIGSNVVLTPATYDFGTIPVSSTGSAEFTLTNPTPAVVTVNCWEISSYYPYARRARPGTCCAAPDTTGSIQLAAGKTCTVVVDFAPRTAGVFDATLEVRGGQCGAPPCAWSNSVTLTGAAR